MSSHSSDHGFSATKIFFILFIVTAVEVAWSIVFKHQPHWIKWGGLLCLAFWKGLLIYTYFMHMKFEGWIVKALVAPTPLLVLILVCALMPDVSLNDHLVYPVGSQLDRSGQQAGKVVLLEDKAVSNEAPGKH